MEEHGSKTVFLTRNLLSENTNNSYSSITKGKPVKMKETRTDTSQ